MSRLSICLLCLQENAIGGVHWISISILLLPLLSLAGSVVFAPGVHGNNEGLSRSKVA